MGGWGGERWAGGGGGEATSSSTKNCYSFIKLICPNTKSLGNFSLLFFYGIFGFQNVT